ncbi:MAG: tyrosine-type recombinase/integrase [Candidatus Ornithomonoglobus sp.]
MKITDKLIKEYEEYITNEEKSQATVKKYVHDVEALAEWLGGRDADKELMLEYKGHLRELYAPASVNAAVSSLNSFFTCCGAQELKLKTIKIQRQIFASSSKELKKNEYVRLLKAAKKNGDRRLYLIMQTIFVTGIRISELRFITAEAVMSGTAVIDCKGKLRKVFIPKDMCNILKKYIKDMGIKSGSIFITRNGNPMDRSNISKAMKRIAELAKVVKEKVFPHNLRHLFARTYYSAYKDIVRLADILGHSSVNTTRIYTRESGEVHRKQLESLNLIYC